MTAHINVHDAIKLNPLLDSLRIGQDLDRLAILHLWDQADNGEINLFFADLAQAEQWARKVLACVAGVEASSILIEPQPPNTSASATPTDQESDLERDRRTR